MTYDEFVAAEKAIEAGHPKFFTGGTKLHDFILIVFNIHTGYKRHEWLNEKKLTPEVKQDIDSLLELLQSGK